MANHSSTLVVFDLGRVLVRLADGWRHACDLAGLPWPGDEKAAAMQAALHAEIVRVETDDCDCDDFVTAAAGHMGLSAEQFHALWRGYLRGPFPGAAGLIADLRSARVPTACLSNTHAIHWAQLTDPAGEYHGVLSALDHQFASHLIPARKPDAAAYVAVERDTGHAPASILFFDDMLENVAAATGRGWRAHLVPRCENPIPLIRQILAAEGVLR